MQKLSRDEYSYKAERDHLPDDAPCKCGSCGDSWRYDQLRPVGDCSLTPGDASPAGRCGDPSCDALAYPVHAAAKYQMRPDGVVCRDGHPLLVLVRAQWGDGAPTAAELSEAREAVRAALAAAAERAAPRTIDGLPCHRFEVNAPGGGNLGWFPVAPDGREAAKGHAERLSAQTGGEVREVDAPGVLSLGDFPPPAPRDAPGLRDSYVAQCAERTGPHIVGAILRAALDLHDAGWGSKSQAAFDARQRLGDAFVSYNGGPFGFRGPLSPDAQPITDFPRGAKLLTAQSAPFGVAQAVAAGAGYRVVHNSVGNVYSFDLPDGGEDDAEFASEAAAWEAAYQHHNARTPAPGEFAKAIEAGYSVTENPDDGGWDAWAPSDGADPYDHLNREALPTERAAWDACDAHRRGEG